MKLIPVDWLAVKMDFVNGYKDEGGNIVKNPTLEQLSNRHSVKLATIRTRASREGWIAERKNIETRIFEANQKMRAATFREKGLEIDQATMEHVEQFNIIIRHKINDYIAQIKDYSERKKKNPKLRLRHPVSTFDLRALEQCQVMLVRLKGMLIGEGDEAFSNAAIPEDEFDEAEMQGIMAVFAEEVIRDHEQSKKFAALGMTYVSRTNPRLA